ncbi:DUF460 domain-containing protein [Candidatus Woesearchaeota archaeon]|nr:DUF460 domain-containing protein [Candidatus Woesearchaeota archaeon]
MPYKYFPWWYKIVLFVGIDPGTTVAYALLDTDTGNITLYSQKELSSDLLVQHLSAFGNITLIATDKQKLPSFVRTIATKLGAVVYSPKEDLQVKAKASSAKDIGYSNSHERDAAGAVLEAYHEFIPKLKEISRFIESKGKRHLLHRFTHMYFKNPELSYMKILELMEPKEKKREESKEDRKQVPHDEKNSVIRSLLKHSQLLQKHINELRAQLQHSPKKQKHVVKQKTDKDLMNMLTQKEKRIINLTNDVRVQQNINRKLHAKMTRLKTLYSSNRYYILPRYDDLRKPVSLKDNRVFVKNANVFLPSSLERIKTDDILVTLTEPSSKLRDLLPCTIILWRQGYEDYDDIIFLDKNALDKELAKPNLNNIIEEYQRKRGSIR